MIPDSKFKSLYNEQSLGNSYDYFGLDIKVASKLGELNDVFNKTESIRRATYDAAKLIKDAILAEVVRQDPEMQKRAVEIKKNILACFPISDLCYVEEIPNGY